MIISIISIYDNELEQVRAERKTDYKGGTFQDGSPPELRGWSSRPRGEAKDTKTLGREVIPQAQIESSLMDL